MDMNRRGFLGMGVAMAAAGTLGAKEPSCCAPAGRKGCPFKLGMAGYTYYNFTLDETLDALEKFDVHGICAKDRHFPLDATPAELKTLIARCRDRGVEIYGAGPLNIGSTDEAKKVFDYAAALGVKTVVGVPWKPAEDGSTAWGKRRASRELCEFTSKLCAEYDIRCAIHNHGRNPRTGSPALYGAPCDTWEMVKELDPRMGLCMDVAYTFADGFDPADAIRAYRTRLFDVHFRNIAQPDNGSSGAPAHKGKIDYVRVVRALKETGYDGWCGIELANAFGKPSDANPGADPSWIPLSVGYFRGLMDAV